MGNIKRSRGGLKGGKPQDRSEQRATEVRENSNSKGVKKEKKGSERMGHVRLIPPYGKKVCKGREKASSEG